MSNKKINELSSAASLSLTDLLLVGNPSSGFAYKTTLSDFKTWLGVQNIYTNDGTITANRTVTLGGYSLSFAGINSVFGFGTSGVTQFNYGQVLKIQNSWTDGSVVISGGLPTTHAAISVYGTSGGDSNLISFDYSGTRNHSFSSTNNYLNYTSGSTYIGYSSAPTEGYKFQVLGVNNVVFIKGSGTGNYLAVYDSSATPQPLFRIGSDGAMVAPTANDISHRIGNLLFKNSTISAYAPITIGSGADGTDPVYFGTKNIYFTATTAGVSVPTNFNLPHGPNNGTQEGLLLIKNFTNGGAGGTSVYNAFFSKIFAQTAIGNVTINHFGVNAVFNTTAGTTLSRGFYYNATSTSSVGLSHIPFENVNGNNYFNSSSGSTLIGYASGTASSYKLDVNGKVALSNGNNTYLSNININTANFIWGGSNMAYAGTGLGNVIISQGGSKAGITNATSNVILGPWAGDAITTASQNVIIGYAAGGNLTTGTYNVLIGVDAGKGITTGGNNTIICGTDASNFPATLASTLQLVPAGYEANDVTTALGSLTTKFAFIGGGYNSSLYMKEFYFGGAPFVTVPANADITFYAPSATSATDVVGSNFTLAAGRGRGAGTPGDLIFATSSATISGTTLQTHTSRWWIKGTTGTLSNVASPNAVAALQIDSTTKGFLPPRLTYAEAFTLAGNFPPPGLIIYVTGGGATTFTSEGWWGYTSTGWIRLN